MDTKWGRSLQQDISSIMKCVIIYIGVFLFHSYKRITPRIIWLDDINNNSKFAILHYNLFPENTVWVGSCKLISTTIWNQICQ